MALKAHAIYHRLYGFKQKFRSSYPVHIGNVYQKNFLKYHVNCHLCFIILLFAEFLEINNRNPHCITWYAFDLSIFRALPYNRLGQICMEGGYILRKRALGVKISLVKAWVVHFRMRAQKQGGIWNQTYIPEEHRRKLFFRKMNDFMPEISCPEGSLP